jgi:glycosyltransferase involved in cell wall biosynthesis
MKKILFVLPALTAGGAERVMSFIAQNLDKSRYDVVLIIVGFEKDSVYNTDNVKTIYLNYSRLLTSMPVLAMQIRKLKPQIVVSAIGHVNIFMGFLSLLFKNISFVGREASVATVFNTYTKRKSAVYLWLMKVFYKKLAAIVCQSEDMLNDFVNNFKLRKDKLVLINNPITIDHIPGYAKSKNDIKQFVTVGRLSREKGFDRVLHGLAGISSYDFNYTIIGSGALKDDINKLIMELNLQTKVAHIPHTGDVFLYLQTKDFFLQGSYVEGFPNAALESCLTGTPVIAFNAPGGTKELIADGVNGFLVNDEEEFVALLNDEAKLESLDRIATRQYVLDKFDARAIVKKYDELFSSL